MAEPHEASHHVEWLDALFIQLLDETRGNVYPPGRRVQVSLACFCIVRDHHHAITVLLDERLYASAFALVRPLYDAAVKGMWLAHCATEAMCERHSTGKELPAVGDLLDDLLKSDLPGHVSEQMKKIKTLYWKALSSLTHAGHAQVKRWITSTGVEPTYTEAEIQEITNATGYLATVSALEMARLADNKTAMANIAAHLPEGESPTT